jgi:uncharacterized protein YjaZ
MKARVIFIGDSFSSSDKQRLNSFISRIARRAAKILKISKKSVYFTVYRFKRRKYNSGFTKAKEWIELTLPTGKIDYKDLEGTLYHEMHHIARGYCGMLEKAEHFLLDTIFSEGLATAFEVEQVSSRLPKHARYTSALVRTWLPRMAKEFSSTTFDYCEWFHGQGKPAKLGYKIGKYLVDEIIQRNPSKTPAKLARTEAWELLKMSGHKNRS